MYTCLFLYDHLCDDKPRNFSISLVSEQHHHSNCSASFQHFFLPHSRANRNLAVIGKYHWNDLPPGIRTLSTKILSNKFLNNILFNIDPLLAVVVHSVCLYVCVCVCCAYACVHVIVTSSFIRLYVPSIKLPWSIGNP